MDRAHVATPSADEPALRHDYALDGVRGLAILMVLACHLLPVSIKAVTPFHYFALGLRYSLSCGVDIFFALSGFLITRILVQTVSDDHFLRNFYARRSLRIFPLYYGVLILVFTFTSVYHVHWDGDQWTLLTYTNRLSHPTAPPDWHFDYGNVSLVNFWSLHIEEQFYFIWPLFVFLLRTPRRLLSLALSVSLACLGLRLYLLTHGVSLPVVYTALITRCDGVLIGACVALLVGTNLRTSTLRAATPIFTSSALLYVLIAAFVYSPRAPQSPIVLSVQYTVLAIAASALITMCLKQRSRTAHIFRTPVLRFFGKYSYGLYIFHTVLPMFYLAWLRRSVGRAFQTSLLVHVLLSIAELAVSLGAAVASYHFFEMPFLRLKRFFPHTGSPAAPPAGRAVSAQAESL